MVRRFVVLAALAGGAISVQTAANAKDVTLEPSSNWMVDWGANSCLLERTFGDKNKPLLLSMRTYEPGYEFEITLAGALVQPLLAAGRWTIAYGAGNAFERKGLAGRMGKFGSSVTFSDVLEMTSGAAEELRIRERERAEGVSLFKRRPDPDTAFEAQFDRITLETSSHRTVLKTGPMAKALSTLRKCTDNLVRKWGLDPAVQRSLS